MKTQQELIQAITDAEASGDRGRLQLALGTYALFLSMAERFGEAQPLWDRSTALLAETTSPYACEVGTFMLNKVEYHLLPAGRTGEARVDLQRVKDIWSQYFQPDSPEMRTVERQLNDLDQRVNNGM
jgi:hypothetical protein